MQDNSDYALIQNARNGDVRAFRTLVEKYQAMAFSVTYKFLNNHNDSEEIVQEAFLRVWKNLSRYRPENKFSTWLYKIISNLCLDLIKSKYHKQSQHHIEINTSKLPRQGHTPLEELESHELLDLVHLAIEQLSPVQKSVFVLRDLEGLNGEEVEKALSMNSGAVKSSLYYARKKVQDLIKKYYEK